MRWSLPIDDHQVRHPSRSKGLRSDRRSDSIAWTAATSLAGSLVAVANRSRPRWAETVGSLRTALTVASTAVLLTSACSDSPGLNALTAPVLGEDFAQCFTSLAATAVDSDAVACFYLDGASRVAQAPIDEACAADQCDLTTWFLGASGPLEPMPNGQLPFPNANGLLADEGALNLEAEVVWLSAGSCPARPPFDPFSASFEQECDGSALATDQQCFASLSIPLRPTRTGLEVRSGGSRFRFSRRYQAEVQQAGDTFDALCTTASTRQAMGDNPTTRTVRLLLTGSGGGEISSPGFPTCAKARGVEQTCSLDVIVGTTIALAATLDDETTLAWPTVCGSVADDTCSVSVGPGSDPITISVDMDLVRFDLTINITSDPQPVAARVTADQETSDGDPVVCALPPGQSSASCTFPIDSGTTVFLAANDGDDFVLQNWGGDCDSETDIRCTVLVSNHRTITANFKFGSFPLTLLPPDGSSTPAGGGRITDATGTIDCGTESPGAPGDCFDAVDTGDEIALLADAPPTQIAKRVLAWNLAGAADPAPESCREIGDTGVDESGRLIGDNQCLFVVEEGRINVTPEFGFLTTVDIVGQGAVSSEQIDPSACVAGGEPCEAYLPFGRDHTFAATPDASVDARFIRWIRNDAEASTQPELVHAATSAASYTAIFGHQLSVGVPGAGRCGTVVGQGLPGDLSIDCGTTCSAPFTYDSTVTLMATAAAGAAFIGWTGEDCASEEECSLVMNQSRAVDASFAFPLAVSIDAPRGEDGAAADTGGRVTGPNIDCAPTCAASVICSQPSEQVVLTAEPQPGYRPGTWTGCSAATGATCQVTMDDQRSVSHRFECFRTVDVSIAGGGILAGPCSERSCSIDELCNGSLLLSAVPANASTPQSPVWSAGTGCDVGALSCVVDVAGQNRSVALTFTYPVTIDAKPANGMIIGPDAVAGGMNCGNGASEDQCSANYQDGVAVDLQAVPNAGYRFADWTGCVEAGGTEIPSNNRSTCRLPMTSPVSGLQASFAKVQVLTVEMVGAPGSVSVTTPDLGTCTYPDTCQYTLDENTQVTMTRTPAQGSVFVGWDGGNSNCTGTNNCTVVMDRDVTAVATFRWPVEARLDVSQLSGGLGDAAGARIRSTTPSCEIDVSIQAGGTPIGTRTCAVNTDTTIDFVVTPPAGGVVNYDFATILETGQQVAGTNLSIDVDRPTTAEFRFSRSYGLNVLISGRGTITDGSTDCTHLGGACEFRVPQQAGSITLTAIPNTDGRGWSISWPPGTCASASGNQCTVTLSGDRTISADFTYPISFAADIFGGVIQTRGCDSCHCADADCFAFVSGLNFATVNARTAWAQLVCDEDCDTADCCSALTERADDAQVGCENGPPMGPFRINPSNPVQSQFLQMPARNPGPPSVDWCTNHGGTLFNNTSTDYQSILDWISGGAPFN